MLTFYQAPTLKECVTLYVNGQHNSVDFVTWSTTERGEIRNFPYPSVFELTGRQKRNKECRSIPQGRSNKSRSE